MNARINIQYVKTVDEMVDYILFGNDIVTCSLVRGLCETAWSYGHSISEDEVMTEFGIGE